MQIGWPRLVWAACPGRHGLYQGDKSGSTMAMMQSYDIGRDAEDNKNNPRLGRPGLYLIHSANRLLTDNIQSINVRRP